MSERDVRLLLVRSAFIGDFLAAVPFIQHVVDTYGIRESNIHFLTMNRTGFDPVPALFGPDRFASSVLTTAPTARLTKAVVRERGVLRNAFDRVLYLGLAPESRKVVQRKRWLLRALLGNIEIEGLIPTDTWRGPVSQYLVPFAQHQMPYPQNKNYLQFFKINPQERACVDKALGDRQRFIALYPSSKLERKIWPIENYEKVARRLLDETDNDILLIGGPEDRARNKTLAESVGASTRMTNVAGDFSLRESMELLSRASLFVGNDGAPMHLAALSGTPTIGLFACKDIPGTWEPILAESALSLRSPMHCDDSRRDACLTSHCLRSMNTDFVLEAISKMRREPVRGCEVKFTAGEVELRPPTRKQLS